MATPADEENLDEPLALMMFPLVWLSWVDSSKMLIAEGAIVLCIGVVGIGSVVVNLLEEGSK
jgi:hypothetical protein